MNGVLYADGVLEIDGGSWRLRNTNWDNYRAQISTVRVIDTINPDSTGVFSLLFHGCRSVQFIDLRSFNTEKTCI